MPEHDVGYPVDIGFRYWISLTPLTKVSSILQPMSRRFDRSHLPPLESVLGKTLKVFSQTDNKLSGVISVARSVAEKVQKAGPIPFYSMRDFSDNLRVPLRTVAIAYERLEAEGLLIRLRGSHTELVGSSRRFNSKISAVVGIPLWIYRFRHFLYQRAFARQIGDQLWKHSMVVDNVMYWEDEDADIDFSDRLFRHHSDFFIWFQPFAHNRESILLLRDRGIRTLVISDVELQSVPAHILIDWLPAYQEIFHHWRRSHKIESVLILEGAPHAIPRVKQFIGAAVRAGLECRRQKISCDSATRLVAANDLKSSTAIVLLDEKASVEFSLRDPVAFKRLASHCRILFARDIPSIPYATTGSVNVDRLGFPIGKIANQASQLLLQWQSGQLDIPATTIQAGAIPNCSIDSR